MPNSNIVAKFKEIFLSKNFFIFVIIGLLNTFNGVWISSLLSIVLNPNLAFVVGYIISLGIAYLLNTIFNFKEKISPIRFLKFALSYIPNFIIQNLTVFLVFNVLKFDQIVAYLVAAILGIPITFLCLKFFAFAKKEKTN